jgi:hypothetical protein
VSARRAAKLLDTPMAITSDGQPLLNITHMEEASDPVGVVERLLDEGHTLFIGVAVPARYRRRLAKDIEGAAAEIVCRIGGRLGRPTKR